MDDLANSIISVAKRLTEGKSEGIKPLRSLKDAVLLQHIGNKSSPESRCYAFILMTFLDDVFYNLAGDFPQEEPYAKQVAVIRQNFFDGIGDKLFRLAKAIDDSDPVQILRQVGDMMTTYLDSIDAINEAIEDALHEH